MERDSNTQCYVWNKSCIMHANGDEKAGKVQNRVGRLEVRGNSFVAGRRRGEMVWSSFDERMAKADLNYRYG